MEFFTLTNESAFGISSVVLGIEICLAKSTMILQLIKSRIPLYGKSRKFRFIFYGPLTVSNCLLYLLLDFVNCISNNKLLVCLVVPSFLWFCDFLPCCATRWPNKHPLALRDLFSRVFNLLVNDLLSGGEGFLDRLLLTVLKKRKEKCDNLFLNTLFSSKN